MISRTIRPLAFLLAVLGCEALGPTDFTAASVEVFGNSQVKAGESITLHTLLKDKKGSTLSSSYTTVTWISSDETKATVGATTGVVTAVKEGTATITPAAGGGAHNSKAIRVTPPDMIVTVTGPASIKLYAQGTFQATVRDAGGHVLNRTVTWSSSNPARAPLPNTGGVNAEAEGSVTIIATGDGVNGVSGTAQLTVAPAGVDRVEVVGTASVEIGRSVAFSVHLYDVGNHELTGRVVTWSSTPPGIVSVSATGVVTGVALGSATITATSEEKKDFVTVSVIPVQQQGLILSGRVIDAVTSTGLAGAAVDLIRASDQSTLFQTSAITQADGSFTTNSFVMPAGGVYVRASHSGYVTGRILVATGFDGTTMSIEAVPLVPTSSQPGGIGGVVRNARTGIGIAGASLALYNNVSSTPVAPANTDATGAYAFTGLVAGTYRVAATAPGFQLAERVGIAVGNNGVTGGQDIVLSPSGTNDIRIVLTWGASPSDLDSHLTGPNTDARSEERRVGE